ncbi:MAG: bifunctional (p)ppGpp synthetase/guanosine-3',5'-bis(diphosphate) 3'-pyrophosphohydrolase [Bacteroidales bacterium]|nr:MAG: bifunctional (p)ppGpp synthetase/guanosine-3',5'-bis(diphosphate) 3'-pyrophosphohydrolase [Bacteroidales bacterium]
MLKEYPENIQKDISNKYDLLLKEISISKDDSDRKALDKAFDLLISALPGEKDITKKYAVLTTLEASLIVVKEIGLGAFSVISIFLSRALKHGKITFRQIEKEFGSIITTITKGLEKISYLDTATESSQAENFRKLLLNLAKDVRVILIRLAEQLQIMREMKNITREYQIRIASESSFLYAPLAHRLGLYLIKSEMEDLSLKYTDRKTYDLIARKLSDKMKARRQFINDFIKPVKLELEKQGFIFEIKGRPKSIYSIWNKMNSRNIEFEDIYDLFAIRIVIDSELKNEKSDCWRVYSIVTDIYQPNPLRLRDWISVPKTNGYESLHTTVIGQEGRWVEIQIRTVRMNEIAEKGFAAHWKYKKLESEQGLEEWLGKIREVLEAPEPDAVEFIDDFKLSLYSKEIFVFTPKGELKKFPAGATVLDFAYDVHSDIGATCKGAKVNGKTVPIRYELNNGERVEIITSKNQSPRIDWLNYVVTSKAKSKIKQKLNEEKFKTAENGKEILKRRFKNWKIPFTDDNIRKLLSKYELENSQELYYRIATESIELADIKEFLTGEEKKAEEPPNLHEHERKPDSKTDVDAAGDFLIIDEKLGSIDYKLARCCNPIPGDDIFGFVSVGEGIKIHRTNCPNAAQLLTKFDYRIVKAKWTKGTEDRLFNVEIKINGEDEPGILDGISRVISKDLKVNLRSISMNNEDGYFEGKLVITVRDLEHLELLISRLSEIKGVIDVSRNEYLNI